MTEQANRDRYDVAVVGGLGHVGLPLGIAFAKQGLRVCLQDINAEAATMVRRGEMPFVEYDAEPLLKDVLAKGLLDVSLEIESLSRADSVIISIGTPIDEYLNPRMADFLGLIAQIQDQLEPNQTIIIRSTIYPGTTRRTARFLNERDGAEWNVAYCPERIVQGYAIRELFELAQIVAGVTVRAIEHASRLFANFSPKIIHASIEEAEMVKLFTNSWRYIQFAVANQYYMLCDSTGVDYDRVRTIMREGYPRAEAVPGSGFAAGPCLLKDTMQLSAFNRDHFLLGHAAMAVNEGLPQYFVEKICKNHELNRLKVGILGMAFKADVDDIRDSLSYKLRKMLRFHGADISCSDEHVRDPSFVSKEQVCEVADIIIVAVPHEEYRGLCIPDRIEVIDCWGVTTRA